MHEPTQRSLAEGEQPDGAKEVPRIIRHTTTQFGWRHVNGIAVIRFLVAVWLVCLGAIYCAFGYWWGVLLFAAAGLVGWLSYQMPRWKSALDAERNVHSPR
jgi:Na+/H+-translocating membrane pyrophosphatase